MLRIDCSRTRQGQKTNSKVIALIQLRDGGTWTSIAEEVVKHGGFCVCVKDDAHSVC